MSDREIYLECEHHKAEQLRSDIKYLNNVIKLLQQENKQLKEVIEEVRNRIKLLGKFDGEKCTRGFTMYTADFNNLLQILDKAKGEQNDR